VNDALPKGLGSGDALDFEPPKVAGNALRCDLLAPTGVTPIDAHCIMEPSDCIMDALGDGVAAANTALFVGFFVIRWRCDPKWNDLSVGLAGDGDVDDEDWLLFPAKLMPKVLFVARCPLWR